MAVTDPDERDASDAAQPVIDLRDLGPWRRWRAWARQADRLSIEGAAENAASALARPRSSADPTTVLAQLAALEAQRGRLREAAAQQV